MRLNESLQDRIIRILIGATVGLAATMTAVMVPMSSSISIVNLVFLAVGIEVLGTGLIGWSPLYALFGFSTNGKIGA